MTLAFNVGATEDEAIAAFLRARVIAAKTGETHVKPEPEKYPELEPYTRVHTLTVSKDAKGAMFMASILACIGSLNLTSDADLGSETRRGFKITLEVSGELENLTRFSEFVEYTINHLNR